MLSFREMRTAICPYCTESLVSCIAAVREAQQLRVLALSIRILNIIVGAAFPSRILSEVTQDQEKYSE